MVFDDLRLVAPARDSRSIYDFVSPLLPFVQFFSDLYSNVGV